MVDAQPVHGLLSCGHQWDGAIVHACSRFRPGSAPPELQAFLDRIEAAAKLAKLRNSNGVVVNHVALESDACLAFVTLARSVSAWIDEIGSAGDLGIALGLLERTAEGRAFKQGEPIGGPL